MDNLKDLFSIMDLNKLLTMYTDPMIKGVENLTLDMLIITTFLCSIDFVISLYKNVDNVNGAVDLFRDKILKFVLVAISIKSAKDIMYFSLNIFLEIGIAFGGDTTFLDGNGMFNFNQIWGSLGEIIGSVAQISVKFNGAFSIFYGLILLVVLILCSVILLVIFSSIIMLFGVGIYVFITLPLNVFTPLADLSKSLIKTYIITGLKISIYLVLMNTSIKVLHTFLEELENIGISQSKNDVSAMLFFLVLIGLICSVFLCMEAMALYILMGSGQGFSFARLGNMASQGINSAVSAGITIAGVFVGGSGLAKLGVDVGVKGTQVATNTVKSFSNVAKATNTAVKKGANAVGRGISKATGDEEKPKSSSNMGGNMKKAKSLFQKSKGKK